MSAILVFQNNETAAMLVFQVNPDHFTFLGNCPPTPPLLNINTYFLLREKCWLRGGVGGQFHRNVK